MNKCKKDFFRGCHLGGAVGDAMSYPLETLTSEQIEALYGKEGIQEPVKEQLSGKALISDDTQMTIFTIDGILWADTRARRKGVYAYIPCLFYAYQKWLYTQTGSFAEKHYEFLLTGEILRREELFARRNPGETILGALAGSINGKYGTHKNRINNSKGYGAVVRSAPIGLYFYKEPERAFQIASEAAATTHGHSDGFLSAGYFAALIAYIIQGKEISESSILALDILEKEKSGDDGIINIIKKAIDQEEKIVEEYEGWVAEEALALSLYFALKNQKDYRKGIIDATKIEGNRNGVTCMTGTILGCYLGSLEIPFEWIRDLELSSMIVNLSDRLLATRTRDM